MVKKIPEQVYRRKKLYGKSHRSYYARHSGKWIVDDHEYGHNCYVETDKNGKPWVKKYYKSSAMKSYKKYGNRKIRYYKGDIKDGGHCFKIYNALWDYY